MDDYLLEKPYSVAIPEAPVTMSRLPYAPRENDPLIDAGTARATPAHRGRRMSAHRQNRTARPDSPPLNLSLVAVPSPNTVSQVTQRRAAYFDAHRADAIRPAAAYRGFRNFDWSVSLTLFAVLVIRLGLWCATQLTVLLDPLFRIWVNRRHRAKHGSDGGTYDAEGRFRPQSFEDVLAEYDGEKKGGPSGRDVWAVWNG
ncbi:uncharacterized protein K441DRAFT_650184 [Cenococcum geophilum 1.58]|uniref:uncharacterized protein n=1 Tax=Cenococcum geophilum 1.58 TaxID=794803 RepID=UPI00358ED699|nr:hypothetical protein K441DRAFT_650184 [Cenococcum geophilum 1.58]